ncbi:MAG: MipA/OmpV family protein, partial [Candidatus Binataceae bacterium]
MRAFSSFAAILAVLILALVAGSDPALAQAASTRSQEDLLETLEIDQPAHGKYSLDIGLGSIMTARLDARATKIYPIVPYISFRYDDVLALDENEARVNFIKPEGGLGSQGWRAGPMIKIDTGRPRFTSSGLQALRSIDRTLELGGFVSYTIGPARLRLNARGDVTGAHGGAIVEFAARSGFFQSGRLSLAAQAEIDWVS